MNSYFFTFVSLVSLFSKIGTYPSKNLRNKNFLRFFIMQHRFVLQHSLSACQ